MSVYRQGPEAKPNDVVILAVTGDDRRAQRIAGLLAGLPLLATLVALAVVDPAKREMAGVLGGTFVFTLSLTAILLYFHYRAARIHVRGDTLSIQRAFGTTELPLSELRGATGEYRQPGLGEQVVMRLSRSRAVPKPILTLELESSAAELDVSNFTQTPDVIARKLRRFLKKGATALAPTSKEVERQAKRHTTAELHTGSFLSRVWGSRLVEVGPSGLRVGNKPESLTLHPWSDVVAAHLVYDLNGGEMIEVELTAGRVVRLPGDYGIRSDELVFHLAPRVYTFSGARIRPEAR